MKQVLTAFAKNTVFANIVMLLIFFAGGIAVFSMTRETFPAMALDLITISVAYPGADPEEIEEGICIKIEEAIEDVEGIKLCTTYSRENRGSALVEIYDSFDTREVLEKIRSKVDGITNLPTDAEKPIITELLINDPVLVLYISGEMSERRLKEWAEGIKEEIQQLDHVTQVAISGAREYEINIEISEEKLREYGLTFSQVSSAIRRSNLNLAGGTIRTKGEEIRVRTIGRKYTGKELSKIVIKATPEGEIITLDRLADIKDGFTQDPINILANGKSALIVNVLKTPDEDALKISEEVNKFLVEKKRSLPKGVEINIFFDSTDMLRSRISLLVNNGLLGFSLVLLLLWMFLDIRLSFWAGMGIPISIAGAMVVAWAIGATINMISLFAFIMVLGIVVDDAIVVGESIYTHRQRGEPRLRAAVDGVSEVGMPVVSAVITTIVAFLPLFFIGGIMGKFIKIIPAIVIACLAISLVECILLLPAHLSHLPDPDKKTNNKNKLFKAAERFHAMTANGLEWGIERLYLPFLSRALSWRYISLCSAIAILALTTGIVASGIIKFVVFPEVDGFVVTANIEYPDGTPPEVTQQALDSVDAALKRLEARTKTISGDPLILKRISALGTTLEVIPSYGPNFGGVQAILLESENRGFHSKDVMVEWEKEVGYLPGVKSVVYEGLAMGPPGAPIEVWFRSKNMEDMVAASKALMKKLKTFEGVNQIRSDHSQGKTEIRLELKPHATTLGVTVNDLARQVYAGYYGEEAVRLQRGKSDLRIKVKYTADERNSLADLENVRIRTPLGSEVPLHSVAKFYFAPGFSKITRTNGLRRITVNAGVDDNKANTAEVLHELNKNFFPDLLSNYPGMFISVQGEQKKMRESFGSLTVGFPMAIIGMYIIIATMFRSYAQPLLILITVPFGMIGAILGHLLLGYNLSMLSVFGMVALSGVVVNDAIVLIERVNENLAEGMRFFDAIIRGGTRRFRAIFLTTLSTVGGLTPLIMEQDLQAQVLIPMAISLAAGVFFATLLTLVLIPSLIAIFNDFRLLGHRLKHGNWPESRESVEPASDRRIDLYNIETTPTSTPINTDKEGEIA